MALAFRDDGDLIDCGNASDNDQVTGYVWLRPVTSVNQGRVIAVQESTGGFNTTESYSLDFLQPRLEVKRATTSLNYERSTALTIGVEYFLAYTFDKNATPIAHLYTGTLTALLTEDSYTVGETDGSGAFSLRDSGFRIGQRHGNTDRNAEADISIVGYIEGSALTLAELQSLQYRPRVVANTTRFMHLGFNGATGTVADWSGNGNNGTPTGTASADHVPLGPPFGFDEPMPFVTAVGEAASRAKFLPLLGVA